MARLAEAIAEGYCRRERASNNGGRHTPRARLFARHVRSQESSPPARRDMSGCTYTAALVCSPLTARLSPRKITETNIIPRLLPVPRLLPGSYHF